MSFGGVCIAPLTTSVSGTERIAADLVTELARRGERVYALVPGYSRLDGYAGKLMAAGAEVRRIGEVLGKRSPASNILGTCRALREWKPATVHFHCPHYQWGIEAFFGAQLAGVPRILRTEHNPLMSTPAGLRRVLLAAADRTVDQFTYVSSGNQARYEQFLPHRRLRGVLINNGIDPRRFQPSPSAAERARIRSEFGFPPDSDLAVTVGFGERRPLRPIFQALRQLLQDPRTEPLARNWRVLVIGSGGWGEEPEIRAAQELGVASQVHFAGYRKDVPQLLPLCDLYVSASHFEGLSLGMLEAAASGLPILSTEVDGMADITGEAYVREFAAPQNDPAAFARMWHRLMSRPEVRTQWRQVEGPRVREEFTTERMVQQYLQLYRLTTVPQMGRSPMAVQE